MYHRALSKKSDERCECFDKVRKDFDEIVDQGNRVAKSRDGNDHSGKKSASLVDQADIDRSCMLKNTLRSLIICMSR